MLDEGSETTDSVRDPMQNQSESCQQRKNRQGIEEGAQVASCCLPLQTLRLLLFEVARGTKQAEGACDMQVACRAPVIEHFHSATLRLSHESHRTLLIGAEASRCGRIPCRSALQRGSGAILSRR